MNNIRNFVVVSHIDHGKSTLADRFLEITGTVPAREMRDQYLDRLELERERGITIKMAPVSMRYFFGKQEFVLNLIDTPGHSDFSYEVSRALAAVEGAILLVDATQGIQAQTLANFRVARNAGLKIIGAVNKVDVFKDQNDERLQKIIREVAGLLSLKQDDIFLISGKTGQGVEVLIRALIERIPPPKQLSGNFSRALIFDSFYDDHKGVIASVRIFNGQFKDSVPINLIGTNTTSKIKEIGVFKPELKPVSELNAGEIGYIATGIKDPAKVKIGDTVITKSNFDVPPLEGYKEPRPVVFVSFYPENNDDYELFKKSLDKLRLNDSAITLDLDQNAVLGRGFKLGFLGRLHFEITAERLRREFGVKTVNTFPSVIYRVKTKSGWQDIFKPEDLPADFLEILEPMVKIEIILPSNFLSSFFPVQQHFRISNMKTATFDDRINLSADMPLAELISDFDDQLKSVTAGYASFSYELNDYKIAQVDRVDIFLAGELVPGLSRFIPKISVERESREMVERLKKLLPKQQFAQAIQAVAGGRVIAREDIPALRKDVTGYLYGGDRSRKMKLWQKQKRGKEKLKERARAKIPPHVFKELLNR